MDQNYFIEHLKHSAETIRSLTEGVSAEQARWKPEAGSWSILEVVNHLYDEEREDFRQRVDYFLNRPGEDFPPIDPQGWVTRREYNQRDLQESLGNYLTERRKSLDWLPTLGQADWNIARTAPFGQIKAGDIFVAWAAHDLLHIRQLVELHWAWTVREAQPFDVRYAGDW
jgi:hypothetical protein